MDHLIPVLSTTHFSHLQCAECEKTYPADQVNTYASCPKCERNILLCNFQLSGLSRESIDAKEQSMWRYFPVLPVFDRSNVVTLGEGFTPLLPLHKMGSTLGMSQLKIKDESFNPTGSFKARGMSAAVSKAKELGITRCIVPTAGNAGGAMAAYCAKAGIEAVVVMPEHTPRLFREECERFGARVVLEKGLISDCARRAALINKQGEYFDLSTLKEPYRLEGKKTMGYEIAEQLNWKLPDVILYPTGGGTGLIGMWKAFHEMVEMGWIGGDMPRMYCIQSAECCPIVETWSGNQSNARTYTGKPTVANGLAVPNPFGERLILQVMKESGGIPVAVSEEEIQQGERIFAKTEGILVGPEGAALWAGLKKLINNKHVHPDENVLLLNTGSGYKYL
ncbi:MAG: threonine synthase [Bacteroidetes bacterium]|nr:threonine synthase [Bacteroidota bacterium]